MTIKKLSTVFKMTTCFEKRFHGSPSSYKYIIINRYFYFYWGNHWGNHGGTRGNHGGTIRHECKGSLWNKCMKVSVNMPVGEPWNPREAVFVLPEFA